MGVLRTLFCCCQQMLSSLFAVASWGSSEFLPSVETSDIFFSPLEVWLARCDASPTCSCGTFPLRFFCAFQSCQNIVGCFTGFVLSTRPTRVPFF
uniref:Putative secreted protein n=1 Tax=Ixodes ricinus TaxID=34613 RepID=A0A6B0UCU6_IXORI